MEIHLQFGVPLPIQFDNIYRLSSRNWLLGRISVPEGIMAHFGRPFLDGQAQIICSTLKSVFPEIAVYKTEKPKLYKFQNPTFYEDSKELLTAIAILPAQKAVGVLDYINDFATRPETWDDPELLEFVDLIKSQLDKEGFDALKKRYDYLKFVTK